MTREVGIGHVRFREVVGLSDGVEEDVGVDGGVEVEGEGEEDRFCTEQVVQGHNRSGNNGWSL